MRKLVWAAALVAVSATALAETTPFDGTWIRMLKKQEPNETAYAEFSYDANTIARTGDKVSFWEKVIIADPKSSFMTTSISHVIANCETQQSAQIAFASSMGSALPAPSGMIEQPLIYKSYPPGSPGGKVITYICSKT
jgi:hypothetical protein